MFVKNPKKDPILFTWLVSNAVALRRKGHLQYPEKRKANLALIKAMDILEDRPYRPYEAVHNTPRETHPYLRKIMLGLPVA